MNAQASTEDVLHVYSARHYPSDQQLYDGFTQATGVSIKRVDADDAGILTRLKTEGARSAADVVLLVDAARLWMADQDGLFLPIRSAQLEAAIPASARSAAGAQGGYTWFGLSSRARVIVYDKRLYSASMISSYAQLADPMFKGRLCLRSASHPYNLSLFSAVWAHEGAQATQTWLKGIKANLARPPRGGDTDQIKSVASGECGVAITNSYYLARLMRSTNPKDQALLTHVGVVFPNQTSWGTHVNIAGGAVARHSQRPELARRFLEYLASEQGQQHFANGNNEWPVSRGVQSDNPALTAMAAQGFKADHTPISLIASQQRHVQVLLDEVGLP
jgi:iron(III) transport system substrate-binding protein